MYVIRLSFDYPREQKYLIVHNNRNVSVGDFDVATRFDTLEEAQEGTFLTQLLPYKIYGGYSIRIIDVETGEYA